MIKNIQRTWFEVWGDEAAQNQILKGLTALLVALVAIQSIALVILSLRKPVLIAVSGSETKVLAAVPPNAEMLEQEVRRIITAYIKARHTWEWNQIEAHLKEAARFVDTDFEKSFKKATAEQIRLAKEKKVSQVFYPTNITLNLEAKTAKVSGDRILMVDGLRATNPMTVEVSFRLNQRNPANPEGVYVTAENLITGQ
ncbi:MAG: hypothetical protein H6617_05910 [Bdellovibrionaceae bacterium]|nr:hypothetical protein [Bdellovibrionales bacterium]MCB9254201.1 hypothetical protein [Pseudobdellovibrionaceae bacterium]